MSLAPEGPRTKSVLWNFKFVGIALAGSLTSALVSTFAPEPAQIAILGSTVSILAGLFVAYVEQEDAREKTRAELLGTLGVPLELAREADLFEHYVAFGNSLVALVRRGDEPARHRFAVATRESTTDPVRRLATGRTSFSATETWRAGYRQRWKCPGL